MKKKLVVFITALVMVFACALGLVACGDDFEEGTYVMYALGEEGGEKIAVPMMEISLKGGKASMEGEDDGTYKVDGSTLTVTFDGDSQKFTQKDNMWQATEDGETVALVKKGSTPKGYKVVEMDF